jgi:hypothetical protein
MVINEEEGFWLKVHDGRDGGLALCFTCAKE